MPCNPTTFVPLGPSAVDQSGTWTGNGPLSPGTYTVDLDDFDQIPGHIEAAAIRLYGGWNPTTAKDAVVFAKPTGATGSGRAQVVVFHGGDGGSTDNQGVVKVDTANRFEIEVGGDDADLVIIEVVGYYL